MMSMTEQPSASTDRRLERAIVLALLSEKDESRYSCAQLARALGASVHALEHALGRLAETGLIGRTDSELWASPAARHMDELGLIAI
jgi:DNA-binding GntR family transcriptional regulator